MLRSISFNYIDRTNIGKSSAVLLNMYQSFSFSYFISPYLPY